MLGCFFNNYSFLGDQSNYNSLIKLFYQQIVRTGGDRSSKHKRKETQTIQIETLVTGSIEGNAKFTSYK